MATMSPSTSNLDCVSTLDTEVNARLWQYLNGDFGVSMPALNGTCISVTRMNGCIQHFHFELAFAKVK